MRRGFAPAFVNYKIWCTRLAAASDKVYQLLAYGRWFSPGTPPSSTTKTGRHDIVESGVKHKKNPKIQSKIFWPLCCLFFFDLRVLITPLVSSHYLGLRVECTIFCNLQRRVRTHAVLVTGLYELLDNPTTQWPIETGQKDTHRSTKRTHKTKVRVKEPH
jgi:hypothetical protein